MLFAGLQNEPFVLGLQLGLKLDPVLLAVVLAVEPIVNQHRVLFHELIGHLDLALSARSLVGFSLVWHLRIHPFIGALRQFRKPCSVVLREPLRL